MGYRLTEAGDQIIALYGADGDPISIFVDGEIHRIAVESLVAGNAPNAGRGSVTGMKYEQFGELRGGSPVALTQDEWVDVYTITEESVFYEVIFDIESLKAAFQIEVDGSVLFNLDGIDLEEAKGDLALDNNKGDHEFSLVHYDSNKYTFQPPDPIYVASSLKVQIKAEESGKELFRGVATRRAL